MKHLTVDHEWIETTKVDGADVERERKVHLVIGGPADLHMGVRRSLLIEEQRIRWEEVREELKNEGWALVEIIAAQILRTELYPSLVAAVVEQEGFDRWPITFEAFSALPEELGVKWEAAVGELHPAWRPEPEPETLEELEEARKKAMAGTSE